MGSWMPACWEMAAYSDCGVFYHYKCLVVSFCPAWLLEWEFISDCPIS